MKNETMGGFMRAVKRLVAFIHHGGQAAVSRTGELVVQAADANGFGKGRPISSAFIQAAVAAAQEGFPRGCCVFYERMDLERYI